MNAVEAALSGLSKNTIQDYFDRIQAQYNEIFSYSKQTLKMYFKFDLIKIAARWPTQAVAK
jgi:hypothetical protein